MDSPDQGAKGIAFSSAAIRNDSVLLDLPIAHAAFHGKLINDSTISGVWVQGGNIPLTVHRSFAEEANLQRPQTPQSPFPYKSEEVSFFSPDNSIHYSGTLTLPEGKGPAPALLLITGSGPQNRDEEIFGHKPFAVIADYLTKRGYAVLRVDDRGTGKTTGDFRSATTNDFATDADAAFNYLKSRKETDKKHLGLLGHSEGGAIAEMLAARRKDVDFIILLAAPGIPATDLLAEQNEAILSRGGLTDSTVTQYGRLYRKLEQAIITSKDSNAARIAMGLAVTQWRKDTDTPIVVLTTGITDNVKQLEFVDQFVSVYNSAWFRNFLKFDPQPYLQQVSCKVLAMGGDKDVQVIALTNLAGIKAALAKSHSPAYEVKGLQGLNHLFQMCQKCTVQEYGLLLETFSPTALDVIGNWLDKNVPTATK